VLRSLDFIILLIAVHTALSILRSGKITLQSGLFPYRYQVYACFIALSLLLPSLAFVNQDHDAYVSQGTFCTLPVRPFWYRLALSWIPRYLILIVILGVYMTIYVYTRRTFGSFDGKFSSGSTISRDIGTPKSSRKSQEMPFPSDLGISPCARDSGTPSTCKPSLGPGIAHRRPRMSYFPSWIRYSFSQSTPIPSVSSETRAPNASPTKLTPILSPQSQQRQSETFSRTAFRTPTLAEALHDPDLLIKKVRKPSPDPNNTLQKRHQAIQRQLRKIFIYPLVYLLMWIPAFINHCYFYTKSHDPPYILSCVSLTCLCLQCAVDCLIFSIREKPWRCKAEAEKAERGRQILDQGRDIEMGPVTSEGEAGTITTCGQGIGRHSRNVSERLNGQSPRQERHWWDEDRVGTQLENTSIHGNE